MFRFLQVIGAFLILILSLFIIKKIMHKSKAYLSSMCVIITISSIVSGIILNTIPMPTQEVRITALQEDDGNSQVNEIALQSVIVDGKEYPITKSSSGTWIYSKKDSALIWVNESDERWIETISTEISVEIPVGAGRTFIFKNGPQYGKVIISYESVSKTYDLYNNNEGIKKIYVADTNVFYDNFIKTVRLAGYGFGIVCAIALAILMVKKIEKESLIKAICGGLALVSVLTFNMNMSLMERTQSDFIHLLIYFNKSFNTGNFFLAIISVPLLYKAYLYCSHLYRKKFTAIKSTICIAVPATFFALFMVIGASFVSVGNLHSIFEDELQLLKALFAFIGYYSLFFFGITWIFKSLDVVDICKFSEKRYFKPIQLYLNAIKKKPFITAFITLLILYIPYIIASYPAIFMGDTPHQFRLIFEMYDLDNAHPITHTLFLKLCVDIGISVFGSINVGLFIYSLSQMFFVLSVVSFIVKLLIRIDVSPKISILLIVYYSIQPRIHSYMMLITKDIISGTFLLIFITALYVLFTNKKNAIIYILLGVSALGALLFRNDSSYVIVISLILMLLIIKNFRRQIAILAAGIFAFAFLWNNVLLKQLDIPPTKPWINDNTGGSVLTSIMYQQTARCVRDIGDKMTDEEKDAISVWFDLDVLAEKYDPLGVDGNGSGSGAVLAVRTDATYEDFLIYQKAWFKMMFKYTGTYVEAILHAKYEYFYPIAINKYGYGYSTTNMNTVKKELELESEAILHPIELSGYRSTMEAFNESFSTMPVFNIMFYTYTYILVTLIWFFYCVYRNDKVSVSMVIPFLILLLVLMAGPTNGHYFRYMYPYALCLPTVIILGLYRKKNDETYYVK